MGLRTPTCLCPSSRKGNVTLIGSKRTSRIKLPDGLNSSRAVSTSPVPPRLHTSAVAGIFITIGGPQAHRDSLRSRLSKRFRATTVGSGMPPDTPAVGGTSPPAPEGRRWLPAGENPAKTKEAATERCPRNFTRNGVCNTKRWSQRRRLDVYYPHLRALEWKSCH